MQKTIKSMYLIAALLFGGCSAPEATPPQPEAAATSLFGNTETAATESAPAATNVPQLGPNDKCTNPYYPVFNGAWWMYAVGDDRPSYTLLTEGGNRFTVTVRVDENTYTMQGQCQEDGIVLMDGYGISSLVSGVIGDAALTANHLEGVTLPHNLQTGSNWSQTFSLSGSSGNATLSGILANNYSVAGFESVTVRAGTFNALKVEQSSSLELNGRTVPLHGSIWYVQDVGIVKTAIDGMWTSELFAYNFPK